MKKLIVLLFVLSFTFAKAQKVDILDKNRKVIKTVDEKDLDKTLIELRDIAKYTGRWVKGEAKECVIKWGELELILV